MVKQDINILIGVNDLSGNTAGFKKDQITAISETNPSLPHACQPKAGLHRVCHKQLSIRKATQNQL